MGNFFDTVMSPIYHAISFLIVGWHKVFSPLLGYDSGASWALAIIMLTVTVRLLMFPLYAKQLNASRAQQSVQPKINELREKYGNDKERISQESMKLYEEHGVNPMSSCLPLLVQMPIFIGLFQVLNGVSRGTPKGYFFTINPGRAESLQNAQIFGSKLSATFWPITDGVGPTQILAGVMIVLMTGVLLFQQIHMLNRNTPPAVLEGPLGRQQKMMIYIFPFIYLFGGLAIPIGTLIYWLGSNIWTLGQQTYIIRTFPTPGTPAYVDWEERLKEKGIDPKEIERKRIEKGKSKAMKQRHDEKVAAAEAVARSQVQMTENATVQRQNVERDTTVRKSADGSTQAVARQQPRQQTRKARKK